jgi:F420-dependent oxidoreductase-like protein
MRYAFKTAPEYTSWADLLAAWQEADELEIFESGWLFDHFYSVYRDADGPCIEAWTAMAALAQATSRLRIGTLVSGIHYRHPAVLANMIATLDIISDGRLEVGLGAGWHEVETTAYGLELGTPGERSERLEEACEVITRLLTQESATFAGRHYALTNARCEPKPVQRPHPPICIGGGGERRTLRTVATYAQHWNFGRGSVAEFTHKRDVLRRHCADIGRDPSEITLSCHVYPDGMDMAPTRAHLAELEQEGLDLAIIYVFPPFRPGQMEQVAESLPNRPE